jgi:hypothetical protein
MKQFKTIAIAIFGLMATQMFAQQFVDAASLFSSNKQAILNLKDGSVVKGFIHDIDRKKGLIEEIVLKDSITKKKTTYLPEQINNMYLPPSGYDKLTRASEKIHNFQKWEGDSLNAGYIQEGYAYFENSEVMIKDKKLVLMVQLINPGFSSKIRVYEDPYAAETTSYGIGGITLAGGDKKSYFVKKGNGVAYKLLKKKYEEEFPKLFGDCPSLVESAKKNLDWLDFAIHIVKYTNECK